MNARPNPEIHIPEFKILENINENEVSNALNELIELGGNITNYSQKYIADAHVSINPYFYDDLRQFFISWRGCARRILRNAGEAFMDESEVMDESDSIPFFSVIDEKRDSYSVDTQELISGIQRETSRRLETLHKARGKIIEQENEKVKTNTPIAYNHLTSELYVRGIPVLINARMTLGSSGNKETEMLAILFNQPTKSMPCDDFWMEWQSFENKEAYEQKAKKNWTSIYQAANRINKKVSYLTSRKKLIDVTKYQVSIHVEYQS